MNDQNEAVENGWACTRHHCACVECPENGSCPAFQFWGEEDSSEK